MLSFSAQPGTVPKRRVTGLGLWEDVRGNAGAGFTHDDEMADVAEDAEGEAEAEAEEVEEDEPETLSVPVATPNFSRQRGKTVDSRPKTSDSLFPPRTLRRGESFTTAYEMWDHTDENQHPYRPRTGRAATETPSVCDHMERPVAVRATTEVPATLTREFVGLTSPHERSPAGESSVSALHSIAQDSLASLLKKDREQRGDGVDSVDSRQMGLDGQADSVLAPEPRPLQLGPSKQPKITMAALLEETDPLQCLAPRSRVSTIGHVAGGMVRFNGPTPDKEEEPKRKTTDLGRARSLGAMARRKSSLRRHDGEIVKMETMLVRIEASLSPKLPVEYDENESLKVKTRVAEKWREYVVVCRESDNPDVPMILRLYKTRSIPAVDKQYVSSRSARDIPLNPKTTRANMYSSLDKTLVIWHPHKRGSLIYIMRPRCSSSSVVWYTFLKTALGEPPCKSLQISVPDLTLTILIENPFERPEQTERNDSGEITAFKQGDVAGNLLKQSMGMLNGVHEWENILDHWKTKERMGLAWRRYDRLEWVHGANEQKMDGSIAMQKTHELELRPKSHYPTESTLADGRRMEEPAPVEGFLIRLTSGKGREKILGRSFHKRLYFAAFDQFLCFCKPSRALPPAPPKNLSRGGIVPTPREISERMPVIYSISPYRLDREENIDWLAGPDAPEKDLEAYNEAQRKITLLSRSIGFVDLAKASRVCRVGSDLEDPADLDWRISSRSGSGGQSGALSDDAMSVVIDDEKCFEIVLDNGLRLKLQVRELWTRARLG